MEVDLCCFSYTFVANISMRLYLLSTLVPLMMGVSSAYFFMSSKVILHQALFVFSQQYESGGRLWYSMSRIVFVVIYLSIILVATVLFLKDSTAASVSFLIIMFTITFKTDLLIYRKFSKPSWELPLAMARINDDIYAVSKHNRRIFVCLIPSFF